MGISNQIPSSRLIQPGVITSAAERPASPFEGQAIYQKDTDEVLYYNGTSWTRPWNMPWGVISYTVSYSNTFTSGIVSGLTTTFTAANSRRYKITTHVTTAVQSGRHIMTVSTTSLDSQRVQDLSITGFPHCEGSLITTGNGTSQTVTVTFTSVSGTMNLASDAGANKHFLLIEDIGPA